MAAFTSRSSLQIFGDCVANCLSLPSVSEFPEATSLLVLFWIFMEIQMFLVSFCRDESPRTSTQNCIFLPHLRTRRCVSIRFSRHRIPCTLPILLTGCPECPRTFRCNGTLHSRRTCRSMRDQANSKTCWQRVVWNVMSEAIFSICLTSATSALFTALYRIWTSGSKWILSNNQSIATLWVLDTRLIVGLVPLVIILITASLSLKM